mgnify:CR=1 FL=1
MQSAHKPEVISDLSAIQYITHRVAPDYDVLPTASVPFSFILPLSPKTTVKTGSAPRWEYFELTLDEQKDDFFSSPEWATRLTFALQLAGLSWLSPDKSQHAGRILKTLDLSRFFCDWKDDNGVSSRGVAANNELREWAKQLLIKNNSSSSTSDKFYPKCSLKNHRPLLPIQVSKNQEGKPKNVSNDLKSIRMQTSRIIRRFSGVIITLHLPVGEELNSAHDLPIIACPEHFHDIYMSKRPLSEDSLKNPDNSEIRDNFRHETDQAQDLSGKKIYADLVPESTNYRDIHYQKAAKLRQYLHKTYKKNNVSLPDILKPNLRLLATIMYGVFKSNTEVDQNIKILKGTTHSNMDIKEHFWLEVDGITIDLSLKIYDPGAPATLATASSHWHQQFQSVEIIPSPKISHYSDKEAETIKKIVVRARKIVEREIAKANMAAFARNEYE